MKKRVKTVKYDIIMYLGAVMTIPCNHDYIMDVKLWC